jgi:hypothetical protein
MKLAMFIVGLREPVKNLRTVRMSQMNNILN